MSDNFLRLISSLSDFIPDETAVTKAMNCLTEYFKTPGIIRSEVYDSPVFIDQGSNWERVLCPYSNDTIDPDWWQSAVDHAYENGFGNFSVIVPCCNRAISLNDLVYIQPAGFAQFLIEIDNPEIDIDDPTRTELEDILGTSIRKIWAHY
jgi:hypothetical protein